MSVRLTTSWDDGHPLDLRVAELLAAHGFQGTFYVPRRNREARAVMSAAELRSLATTFEIGGHTIDHVRLNELDPHALDRQLRDGKRALEDELGRGLDGFCYPGGVHTHAIRRAVRRAGFRYARTIENFRIDEHADPFRMPTTIQLYPHRVVTYLKNFASGGSWGARSQAFRIALRGGSLETTLRALLAHAEARGGVFHLWGHSWEIDEHDLWGVLERLLRSAAALVPRDRRVTNGALVDQPRSQSAPA